MRLWLAALVVLGVVLGVLLLPRGDPARIAALECGSLLRIEPEAEGPTRSVGDAVLDGPAVEYESPRKATLYLWGVRFGSRFESDDIVVHDLARRSLVRELRKLASERGLELEINGETTLTGAGRARGASFLVVADGPTFSLQYTQPSGIEMRVARENYTPPGREAVLPPLIAIVLALLWRKPLVALLAGIFSAAWLALANAGIGWWSALYRAPGHVATELFWPQLSDTTNLRTVAFTLALIAMIGVIGASGGMRGVAERIASFARGPRTAQVATWLSGLCIFFDDYARCILGGATLRGVTDRFNVSREKLAYLVDSTAAPVASIAVGSTWLAFQVSTFAPQLPGARLSTDRGVAVFVEMLPYRFYCFFTLFLALAVALSGRDWWPMNKAERRARSTGRLVRDGARIATSKSLDALEPESGISSRAHRAVLPVLTFVLVTAFEIARVGFARLREIDPTRELAATLTSGAGWLELLKLGDSVGALLAGSLAGLALAALLAFAAGLRASIVRAAWRAIVATFAGILILYCAWMIAAACAELGTASYLTELVGDKIAPQSLPLYLFLLACGVSFATGTSWGTMGLLAPLVVGLAFAMGERVDGLGGHALVVISLAAVFDGAIFGDHCSPLASTSILTSISTSSDLIDHVRTQLPYGLAALAATLCIGLFPTTYLGWSPWLSLAVGCATLLTLLLVFGRRSTPAIPR